MALDDFLISTGVDQLIRLVKERGKVEINAAASELKLPPKTVEDWAHVLEGEGVVEIDYKLTKIFLVWKTPTREFVAQKSQKLAEKAAGTKNEIDMLLAKVQSEGKQLSEMKHDVETMAATPLSEDETEAIREKINLMEKDFEAKAEEASEQLEKLRKKAVDAAAKRSEGVAEKKAMALSELKKELSVLKRFDETLEAQGIEAEGAYSALEEKIEAMRKEVENSDSATVAKEISAEIEGIKAFRSELLGAVEALAEEVASIDAKITALDERASLVTNDALSVDSAKKKLTDLRRMADEARRQKTAVKERLTDSLTLVKKQSEKIEEILQGGEGERAAAESITNEYIDIAEEISRANEELSERQKQISARLSAQMASVQSGRPLAKGKLTKEEVNKVSTLLADLADEQAMLEDKVRLLQKESEILKLEATPARAGRSDLSPPLPPGKKIAPGSGGEHAELVERIRISQEDEVEFERKREELRALIRNMWEDSRGGPAAPA